MKTYKIIYLDYNGNLQFNIEESVASSNYVRDRFIEEFTEETFVSIEIINL